MWSRLTTSLAAATAATALALPTPAPSQAAVLLEDGFDQENGGLPHQEFDYRSFRNWDVVKGSVDLVGNGFHDYWPGNGLYVDLVGWTAGGLVSKQAFALDPGEHYQLRFELAGSNRSDENSVTVQLGSAYSEVFTLATDDPPRTITRTVRVGSPETARLAFDHAGPDDTWGLFLNYVALNSSAADPPAPPGEPAPEPPTPPATDADLDGVPDALDRSVVTAPPQPEQTATAQVRRGTVRIRERGGFRPLHGRETVPIGATIDATDGAIEITVAADTEGATLQSGTFSAGVFKLEQVRRERRRRRAVALTTVLVLKDGSGGAECAARARALMDGGKRRKVRRLWGDAKGRFRTRGRYGAATVRGTVWLTKDRCDGTLVRVEEGRVAVDDFDRDRTVLVRAGGSYVAKAPAQARAAGLNGDSVTRRRSP